eukprot:scaffold71075_cov21-Tisochrysis_lutea.AAC.4
METLAGSAVLGCCGLGRTAEPRSKQGLIRADAEHMNVLLSKQSSTASSFSGANFQRDEHCCASQRAVHRPPPSLVPAVKAQHTCVQCLLGQLCHKGQCTGLGPCYESTTHLCPVPPGTAVPQRTGRRRP